MAVTFVLGSTSKDGVAPIKVRVQGTNPPVNVLQSTGLFMAPNIFKRRNEEAYMSKYRRNEELQKVIELIEEIRRKLQGMYDAGETLNREIVHEVVSNITNREQKEQKDAEDEKKRIEEERANKITFSKFIDSYIKEAREGNRSTVHGKKYASYSLTNINQAITKFHEFEEFKGCEYDFEDINLDFYYQFQNFLTSRNYALNTVGKTIDWIKTFMSFAESEGLHTNPAYRDKRFKGVRVDADSIYLTNEDLNKLREVDISDMAMGYTLARDKFFIGVWTAQRVSDYNNINKDDVKVYKEQHIKEVLVSPDSNETRSIIVEDEVTVLNITQQKTGAKVSIPCSPELKAILEKYDYNVPHLADQKINEYIKEIAKRAGLDDSIRIEKVVGGKKKVEYTPKWKLVHTHTARRTGATLMYLSGMDLFDIMKITGHTSPASLKKYIKADELDVAQKIVKKYEYFR